MDKNSKETDKQNVTVVGGAFNISGTIGSTDNVVIAGGNSDGKVTTLGLGKVNLGASISADMARLDVGGVSAEEGRVPEGEVRIQSGVTATFGGDIGSPEDRNLMIKIEEGATATFNLPGFVQHIVTGPAEFSAAQLYSMLTPDAGTHGVTIEEAPTTELHSEVPPLGASDVGPVDHVDA